MITSQHGQQRLTERAQGQDPEHLLHMSRLATDEDLFRFRTCRKYGSEYRVAWRAGVTYLLVIGAWDGKLITILRL